jgi:hypothetical protein
MPVTLKSPHEEDGLQVFQPHVSVYFLKSSSVWGLTEMKVKCVGIKIMSITLYDPAIEVSHDDLSTYSHGTALR